MVEVTHEIVTHKIFSTVNDKITKIILMCSSACTCMTRTKITKEILWMGQPTKFHTTQKFPNLRYLLMNTFILCSHL